MRSIIVVLGVLELAMLLNGCGTAGPPCSGAIPTGVASPARETRSRASAELLYRKVAVSNFVSCVEEYSPENLAHRSFAFDGTVKSIEMRKDPAWPSGVTSDPSGLPWVTFQVNRWYKGGEGGEVAVWMQASQVPCDDGNGVRSISTGTFSAHVGTRLLVAGEPWGIGTVPEQGIAWNCGFTQPYTAQAAAEWEAATTHP